jgi:hypothetical protein
MLQLEHIILSGDTSVYNTPGHVCRMTLGSFTELTSWRLTSRMVSSRPRFALIMSRLTTSTSIAPLDDPRVTLSFSPWSSSQYLDLKASKKG